MLGLGNLLTKSGVIKKFPNDFSFNFDGSNDYLDCGLMDITVHTNASVSCWVKLDVLSQEQQFLGCHNNKRFYFGISSTNKPFLGVADQYSEDGSALSVSTGQWNHYALVADGGTATYYFNGSSVHTMSYTQSSATNPDNPFLVGARNDGGTGAVSISNPTNGCIDEVALWDSALSASDVTKIASKPVDFSKASTYATDRTSNLKLWLRAGDKVLPESDASIARSDFYTDFDGVDDLIKVDADSSINNLFATGGTFTAWVNLDSAGETAGRIAQKGFVIYTSTSDGSSSCKLSFNAPFSETSGDWITNNREMIYGEWQHIAITYSGSSTSNNPIIYINGISVAITRGSIPDGTISADTADLYIGNRSATDRSFEGSMSNFTLHKTILDAQTIKQFAKSRYTPMRDNRFSVVDFDGTNDYIAVPDNDSLDIGTGNVTVSAWVKPTDLDASYNILDKRGSGNLGIEFMIHSTDRLFFRISDGTTTYYDYSGSLLTLGQWHHVCAVWNPSTTYAKFYLDGVDVGRQFNSTKANVGNLDNTSELRLGRASNGYASNYFDGSISSVSLYNVEKSAEEVYAIYQQGITYDESSLSGLVGYWRMGDDTSKAYPTIADSSSNSNDGTASGAVEAQQMVAGYDMGAFESTEELGSELNPNSTFSNFTGDVPDGWTVVGDDDSGNNISQGSAGGLRIQSDSSAIYAQLADVTTSGKIYKYSITLANLTDDDFNFNNGSTIFFTANGSSVGTHTGYFEAVSTFIRIIRLGSCDGEVTAFSLKEVLQSDLSDTYPFIADVTEPVLGVDQVTNGTFDTDANWSKGTGWSINTSTKKAECDGTQTGNTELKQQDGVSGDLDFVVGKTYKVTFDVTVTAGAITYIEVGGGTDHNDVSETQDNVIRYITATSTNDRLTIAGNSTFEGTVDNVVVKEVQGNVGTMTQMLSSNLVYSSVLPDQSFLTGVNSAYNFLDLDGSDAYVDTGSSYSSTFNDSFTVSFWVESDDGQGSTRNFAGTEGTSADYLEFRNVSTGKLSLIYRSDGGTIFTATTNDVLLSNGQNNWHHIVFVLNNTTKQVSIYFDGENKTLDSTDDGDFTGVTISAFDTGRNLYIGANNANGTSERFYNGSMNQFAIWNKALSSSEISAIYTAGRHTNLLDSYSDNLKGYYAFGALDAVTGLADTDSTIYDRSGNSNHGTTSGTATGDLKSPPNAQPEGYSKQDTNRSTTTP